jgi:hypothetical protein
MSTAILNKKYGGIYEYHTLHRAKKPKICRCGRRINIGEIYLLTTYGRSLPELQPYALCFECFRKCNPHVKKIIDKKCNVLWEEVTVENGEQEKRQN